MTVIMWVWHEIIDTEYKFKTRSLYTFNTIEPKLFCFSLVSTH